MGGGRGDRMVLVDAAENPGRLGYQLWALALHPKLPCRPSHWAERIFLENSFERSELQNGSCCS